MADLSLAESVNYIKELYNNKNIYEPVAHCCNKHYENSLSQEHPVAVSL